MNPPAPQHFPAINVEAERVLREVTKYPPLIIEYVKSGYEAGECHPNIEKHIMVHGGTQVYGWVVWESPPYEVKAEFHSIWQTPDGHLRDLTPPLHRGPSVVFAPADSGEVDRKT